MNLNLYSDLLLHLRLFHSYDSITNYKCLVDDCLRTFDTLNSFGKHIKCHQTIDKPKAFHCVPFLNKITNNNDNNNHYINEPTDETSETINSFKDSVYNESIMFISKWYNESVIPKNKVQAIISDVSMMQKKNISILKNEVLNLLNEGKCELNSTSKITAMFDIIQNPFDKLESEFSRIKKLKQLGVYITPIAVHIGNRLTNNTKNNTTIMQNKDIYIYYIPLDKVFKIFLEQPNVFKIITNNLKKLFSSNGDIICSLVQCNIWKENRKNYPSKIIIPYLLYFDDYETNNPLGSHAGKKKLGAIYIYLSPCLPYEFSSTLDYIFLALIFNSLDRTEFGNSRIFQKLISSIKYLENSGIDITVENKNYKIYFKMVLILGDNLGLHSILNLSESFMFNYPCRFCKSSKLECNFSTVEDVSKLRNKENYCSDLEINNLSLTGLKGPSIWNELSNFHVTSNFSVDIMHDVLEGVCNYDLSFILLTFINDFKYFSLEILNNRIQYFSYGQNDIQNRPK